MKKELKKIKDVFSQGVFFFYNLLIKPQSQNANKRRREFVLNILLTASLTLSLISSLITFLYRLFNASETAAPPLLFLIICLFFAKLLFLSRKKHSEIIAYIFIFFFLVLIIFSAYIWGADMPQSLLSYALLIIMSGILISTKFSFLITLLIGLSAFTLNYLQINNLIQSDNYWRQLNPSFGDILVYTGTLFIIAIITWLYNKELEKSLEELENIVEERTRELKEAQLQVMAELYKSAEFGRMASGLIHDTINHLNALSLNIEVLGNLEDKGKNKFFIEGALNSSQKLMDYVKAVHKQLRQEGIEQNFNLQNEINDVIKILDYKAKKSNIIINNVSKNNYWFFGNALKFNQIISNLLNNAIDAYDDYQSDKKQIEIKIKEKNNEYIISVQDWGKGIATDILKRIFDPFFTSKGMKQGCGIGLANVLQIIEKDFNGKIKVQSTPNFGTTFIINLPINKIK